MSNLLISNRLSGRGKYYASEVSIDYGTSNVKRIDFMQFEPKGVIYQSDIEKGTFTCYEVKSCREDVFMGNESDFSLQSGRQKAVYNGAVVLHAKKWKVGEVNDETNII